MSHNDPGPAQSRPKHPSGWESAALRELTTTITKGTTPTSLGFRFAAAGIRFIKAESLRGGVVDQRLCAHIDKDADKALARSRLQPGDVLFSIAGTLGRVAIVRPQDIPANTNQAVAIVRLIGPAMAPFVALALIGPGMQEIVSKERRGVGLFNLNLQQVGSLEIPVPPLPEQHRIVAEIEKHFTRLDAAVAALERVRANLKRYRAAVLNAACEGRLVPTEAELARREGRTYEPADQLLARILKERRARWEADQLGKMQAKGKVLKNDKWKGEYTEPASPDTRDLGSPPEGWMWATADQCTNWITDGEHITPERSPSGVLLLSARNIQDGWLSLEEVDFVPEHVYRQLARRLTIEPGDVLLSCSGSVGRSCVAPMNIRFALVRSVAVLKPAVAMGSFISYALRSPFLQAQISEKKTQTAQANIFQGKIKTLVLPVPPLAEQHRIVAEVERRLSVIDELDAVVDANLKRAERLRQSILKRAFEGKLVPQDPNDEPASVLLERIRAERQPSRADARSAGPRPYRTHHPTSKVLPVRS